MPSKAVANPDDRVLSVRNILQSHSGSLTRLLGTVISPPRYLTIAAHLYRYNKLDDIQPEDFCIAVMRMACLGLDPDPTLGHVYLLPFRDGKSGGGRKLEIVIGYKGRKELAYRSGFYSQIHADVVYEDEANDPEVYHAVRGNVSSFRHERKLSYRHRNAKGELKPIVGAYSIAHLKDDPTKAAAWVSVPIAEILMEHRDRSPSFKSGSGKSPWITDYAAMCRKTAVHILSADLRQTPQGEVAARIDGMHPDSIDVDFEEVADAIASGANQPSKPRKSTQGLAPQSAPPTEQMPEPVELSKTEAAGIADFLLAQYGVRKGDATALKRFLTQTWEGTKQALMEEAAKWKPKSETADAPKAAEAPKTEEVTKPAEAPKKRQANIFC